MRILHVAHPYAGGVRTAIHQYATSTPEFEHWLVASETPDGDVDRFARVESADSVALLRFVLDAEVDVVHLHSSRPGLLRAAPIRAGVVYTPHCYAITTSAWWARPALLVERVLAGRSVIAGCSRYEAELGRSLGAARSCYVPHATAVQPPDDRLGGDGVVVVGRVAPQKDPDFLVAALDATVPRPTWIGSGPLEQTLRHHGIAVTGWAERAEVVARVRAAEVLVHPAAWEGSPLAVLESISNGTPALVRDVPTVQEWVSLQKQLGLRTDTPSAFRASLREVLEDAAKLDELYARQRDYVRSTFTVPQQRAALRHAYDWAVGGSDSASRTPAGPGR